jgi:CBS domain-containing protein
MLAERGFNAIPVIDHAGNLVGFISEADLIRNRFAAPESPLGGGADAAGERPAQTAGEVMTGPPTDIMRLLARTDARIAVDVRRHLRVLSDPGRWRVR